jgi:hypothetical protein
MAYLFKFTLALNSILILKLSVFYFFLGIWKDFQIDLMGSDSGVQHSRLLGFLDFSRRPGLYYYPGTETDPVSDTLWFLEYWTMEKVQKA